MPAGLTDSSNPIDAFVVAEYREKGLTPVGPADRRVLLRRVTIDLTGLPPTTAEQDAFLKDQSPDAYETVVDRLTSGLFGASFNFIVNRFTGPGRVGIQSMYLHMPSAE